MTLPYNEIVMEHFQNPRNVGRIEDPDGKAIEGSPACGDMVAVYLKVNDDTHRIEDIKFESYGCASNIATGSIITELAKGKTIEEAREITWQEASDALGGLPAIKTHCSVLAVDGLQAAIQNYEERKGLITERVPTDEKEIRRRLKRVMNPQAGLDLIRTKTVTSIELDNGTVRIALDMPADHQFANNVRDEIIEKIEPLWDVNEVQVIFAS
ncbi:MAG: iron-sulfur cluster assembly scaffold protein [Anaerolineae bacterium]|jgi:nitrogen fixation NifU-like protein